MNWKNITIGKKIAIGFAVILALLGAISLLSVNGVGKIVKNAEEVIDGNKLDAELAQKEVDHLNWAGKVNALLIDNDVTTLQVETDAHQCGFGKWLYGTPRKEVEQSIPGLAPLLKRIEEPHQRLHESAIEIGRLFQAADLSLGNFLREKKADHLIWMHAVKDALLDDSRQETGVEKDPAQCSLGKWLDSSKTALLRQKEKAFAAHCAKLRSPHERLHQSVIRINDLLAAAKHAEALEYYNTVTKIAAEQTLDIIDKIVAWHDIRIKGMHTANSVYATRTLPALQETRKLLDQIRAEAKKHIISDAMMLKTAQSTRRNVTVIGASAIAAGILLAVTIAQGIIRLLKQVAGQMDESASQVAAVSLQVSSSSQSLAEGASEQAASIEETSSSLEEMASMTKQNANNAGQANNLMQDANHVTMQANQSMNDLTISMVEISKASKETSEIIKTIDEIAFQTNLLALNAAVESARAGEAGSGFAVVADEVRNLAMRATEAARDTATLIEETLTKVNDGSMLVNKTNQAFNQVAASVSKVSELVGEITAASDEQAGGIEQVNRAVAEMDKVTQQNAANAEEAASASEEMNAQAEQMKCVVEELTAFVGSHIKEKTVNADQEKQMISRPARQGRKADSITWRMF